MSLSAFNTISRYILNSKKAGIPLQAYYVINYECNLKCRPCNFWKGIYKEGDRDILDTQGAMALIDRISKLKIPYLVITGGEPFLRKDLLEILEYAVSRIKHVRIQTNGTLLTSDDAEKVVRLGLDEIWVSIDGLETTHDWLRGEKGSFRKTMDALESINYFKNKHKSSFPNIIMHTIVFKHNMREMTDILDLAGKCGAGEVFFSYVCDVRQDSILKTEELLERTGISSRQFISEGTLTAEDHMIPGELLREVEIFKRKTKKVIFIDPLLKNGKASRSRKRCDILWSSIMISPYGEVLTCPMMDRLKIGGLERGGLMDMWNSKEFKKIRELSSLLKLPICEDCCCQRRTVFDHFRDPANFKRVFLSKNLRGFIYRTRIGI